MLGGVHGFNVHRVALAIHKEYVDHNQKRIFSLIYPNQNMLWISIPYNSRLVCFYISSPLQDNVLFKLIPTKVNSQIIIPTMRKAYPITINLLVGK
jgi:hypothetical protein